MAFGMGRVPHRLRVILLVLASLAVLAYLHLGNSPTPAPQKITDFSIIKARDHFSPPIYESWDANNGDIQKNCRRYWSTLVANNKQGKLQLGLGDNFAFEPRIYKKSKWFIKAKADLRRKLHESGEKMNDSHLQALEERYRTELSQTHRKENAFVDHITHLRVWGKCFVDIAGPGLDLTDPESSKTISTLIPWLPKENAIESIKRAMDVTGRGLVFLVFPDGREYQQVERIARTIQVLRVQKNELPIQVSYFGENSMTEKLKKLLERTASSKSSIYPPSSESFLKAVGESNVDEKSQSISFQNLKTFVAGDATINHNLVFHLAMIYSPFEEVIYISSQTIPMTDVSFLFSNERYKDSGMYFFKEKASLDFKIELFPRGFFETNELVNRYSGVKAKERALFGLKELKSDDSKWYIDLGFSKLLDPSMIVLNKRRSLPGLFIGSILPFHSILSPKYDVAGNFNPEFLWLGQKLAGSHERVAFNTFFASLAGVPTPMENLPKTYLSHEICSASWSQILDEDNRLLYVTSHQLENRVLPGFASAVFDKLTVEKAGADNKWIGETVGKNLLYIKNILQPRGVNDALINDEGQPHGSYSSHEDFGAANNYWCAYDIVGGSDQGNRGFIVDVSESDRSRYLFYLDMWLQDPSQ